MAAEFARRRGGSGGSGFSGRPADTVGAKRLVQAQKRMIDEMERRRRALELRLAELALDEDGAEGLSVEDLRAEAELMAAQLSIYADELSQLYRTASEQAREVTTRTSDATRAVLALLEHLDPDTYRHSQRVARYADAIARFLDITPEDRQVVILGALLHDIGFIGRPQVQRAASEKTLSMALYRQHPLIGARILRDVSVLERAVPVVLYHHERLDGLGFPRGLRGPEIPLHARIVAVADAYDSMITRRPFSPHVQEGTAPLELRRNAGSRYDRRVVDALIQARYHHSWKTVETRDVRL